MLAFICLFIRYKYKCSLTHIFFFPLCPFILPHPCPLFPFRQASSLRLSYYTFSSYIPFPFPFLHPPCYLLSFISFFWLSKRLTFIWQTRLCHWYLSSYWNPMFINLSKVTFKRQQTVRTAFLSRNFLSFTLTLTSSRTFNSKYHSSRYVLQ